MKTGLKRGLALGLAACVAATSLAGCGKKELDTTAAAATLDGEEISVGLVNCVFRYQQAQFETYYGSWLKSYYGDDIWSADLSGSGTAYGDTFKEEVMTSLEKMLLAEKHMADYGVELSDEDREAISAAAAEFVAANGEEVLKEMSATTENVERMLTLYTIQYKMEAAMGEDVDTEVSDDEAAQRTVSYVRFDVKSEEETETLAEEETEAVTEAGTEAAEAEETGAEEETAPMEASSEAAVTEAEGTKTESADETEAETEAAAETASEADTEAVETEAVTENDTEEETEAETEDEETRAAKAEAKERAEAFLAVAKESDDFAAAAAEVTESDADASTSTYTFGDDDTYPDEAIINATKDLEDGAVVDEVIEVSDSYYVLHVDDAFDEEATADKKEEIIEERRQDAVDALYEEWLDAAEFTVNEDVYAKLIFDIALTIETEAATEAETEAVTEAGTEEVTEASETETATEEVTEASETEAGTETVTEAVTEEAAE